MQIHPELVEKFTGQHRITSIETASTELAAAKTARDVATHNHRVAETYRWWAIFNLALAHLRLWFASLPTKVNVEPFILMVALGIVPAIGMGLGVGLFLNASPIWIFSCTVAPFLVSLAACPLALPRNTEGLRQLVDNKLQSLVSHTRACQVTSQIQCDEERLYGQAKQLYEGLVAARNSEASRLLQEQQRLVAARNAEASCLLNEHNQSIRSMSGNDFEAFLAKVFQSLGYEVTQTGQSGDHGVDLIVCREGVRIAVQAKCWEGSVGNSAIQEVFTAMHIRQCHKCIVVTSSNFTRNAEFAAEKIGCRLIDGSQIRDLILGHITL